MFIEDIHNKTLWYVLIQGIIIFAVINIIFENNLIFQDGMVHHFKGQQGQSMNTGLLHWRQLMVCFKILL